MVAAIAAARSADVAFIVMLAGTAVPGDQVLRQQARDLAIVNGATPEQVERIVTAFRAGTDAVLRGASQEEQARSRRRSSRSCRRTWRSGFWRSGAEPGSHSRNLGPQR